MPCRRLFVGESRAQDGLLGEGSGDQLQADGQPCPVEAARQRQPTDACQIERQGEYVRQVHAQRVAGLLADAEGGCRAGGAGDDIDLSQRQVEILLDQRAHLLRLEIVGIIVARAEGIGAEHDPALDLRPETLAARAAIRLPQRFPRLRQAVADAVVARQVGRRLRRRDQVVDRQRQVGVRQADRADLGAQILQRCDRPAHRRLDLGLDALDEVLLRHADAQPSDPDLTLSPVP